MEFNFESIKRTKAIPGGESLSQYRSVMRKIMEGLTGDNLNTLLFLCKDHIPPSRDIKSTLDFLKYLEDRDLVSHNSAVFIAEALHIIRRMDLLKLIPCIRNKKHFEDEFLAFTYSSFSSYRVLTVQLQEELSQRDFESFRHECSQHLNIRSIDAAKNVLSLLRNLEEEDVIDGGDFTQLLEILKNIDNVKPLKMFQRLLDGDESVVLPSAKQHQYRQNSDHDMFPDRRRQSAPTPPSDPPSYHAVGRVESMPYLPRPSGLRATISRGNEYPDPTTKKYVPMHEPAQFNFDNPDAPAVKGDSRWFAPDSHEVTPKAPVAYAEPMRMEPYQNQSLPPQYTYHDPYSRSHSDDFASLPAPTPQFRTSMHPVATYPQMQGLQDLAIDADNRPVFYQQGYNYRPSPQSGYSPHVSPPQSRDSHVAPMQSQFDPRISPPQSQYARRISRPQPHGPQMTPSPSQSHHHQYSRQPSYLPFASELASHQYHEPPAIFPVSPTSPDRVDPQQNNPQMLQAEGHREHDSDSSCVSHLVDKIEALAVPDHDKTEGVAVEKVVRDSPDNTDVEKPASDAEPEVQEKEDSKKQYEELRAQILRERKDGCYKMDGSPVGLCVLINNVDFVANRNIDEYHRRCTLNKESGGKRLSLPNIELSNREGSDNDADKLEMLFERFDFDVQRHDDADHRKMQRVLTEASETDHTNYNCFILIILSHGEQGCVYGVDGYKVSVSDIQAKFFAENCKTLANKPKIIIIQACQGGKTMPVAYAPVADIESDGPVVDDNKDNGTPNKADFLLAYSTVPGYISYRSRLQGTYYVQEIVRIFKRYYQEEDLLSMMIMVTDEVGKYGRKQVPMPIPTLRKKVYFHLKQGCSLDDLDDSHVTEFPSIEPRVVERVMQETQNGH